MKIRVPKDYCKRCVWLNQGLFPFKRCVKRKGFSKDGEKHEKANRRGIARLSLDD